jgi:hypothetical protein
MTGVEVNVLSIANVGNISLMPGEDANELSIVTVSNNVSLITQYIYIYTRNQ